MSIIRRTQRVEQPQGLPRLRRDHPLGAVLDAVWLPQGGGLDHESGVYTPLPSTASLSPHPRGLALANTGSTEGTAGTIRAVSAFPFVMFAYGYFNSTAAFWRLLRLRNSAGASVAELILSSSTQVAFRAQGSGGTQRTLAITPTGGVTSNPMLMLAVARSSTDYSLFVNGQQADGTLDFGSSISLDRAWAISGNLNGGVLAAGYGQGRALPNDWLLDISRDPRALWEVFEPRRVLVPVSVSSGGQTVALGQVSETDTAQALTVVRGAVSAAIGQVSSTETAQALTVAAAVGQVSETDTAQTLAPLQPGAFEAVAETDTAQALAVGASVLIAIDQVSSTETAQALTPALVISAAVSAVQETDTAQVVTMLGPQTVAIGQVSSTETAQALTVTAAGGTAAAADVWDYVLANGKTAEVTVLEIHTMLSELHLIHGLTSGSPMSVSSSARSAGAVAQTISELAGTVTVTRT